MWAMTKSSRGTICNQDDLEQVRLEQKPTTHSPLPVFLPGAWMALLPFALVSFFEEAMMGAE